MPASTTVPRIARSWSSRLWLLAAVLGGTTVYSGVTEIHSGNQQRLALGLVTQATAVHLSALASARLERLAIESFAPAGPIAAAAPGPSSGVATTATLAERQRRGLVCACRDLLPVTHFVYVDPASGRVAVAPVDTTNGATAIADTAPVLATLRTEANTPRRATDATSRLIVDPTLGRQGLIALVQRDDHGSAVAVYGMIVDVRQTLATLFGGATERSAIDSAGLTRLDSLSLEVRTAAGERLFGELGTGRGRAVAMLGGPLRGLRLDIALSPGNIASPLLDVHSTFRLWHLGLLLLATIVVLIIAVGASRRELLLARARSDFVAGVSHDLRMPLAQILIASETLSLQRERGDAERVSLASSIVRETRRLIALADNVLLFSRSGALPLQPVMRPIAVDELFEEVADAVRLAVEDAQQTIESSPAPSLSVMGDRRLVRQALVNLVDNALKYGKAGQCITLGAEARGDRVQLQVDDEGPGIPESERGRIFEPYARLAHDQVSERTGTGLGLAVVRQIADACDGRVWIERAPTAGARIVMELRGAAAPPEAATATASAARGA